MTKFVTAQEAVRAIENEMTVAVGGFNGFGTPDELILALRDRFLETGSPRDLTLMKSVSVGDRGSRGVNQIAMEGLIKKVVSSHVGLEPAMAKLIEENKCLAYMVPLGTMTELYRSAAAGRSGVLTHVGLETFVDPRLEGGKANDLTKSEGSAISEILTVQGEDRIFYPTIPVDVCLIRGTYADRKGNIVLSKEAMHGEQLEAASAAHNHGGTVIVQVEQVVDEDFDPRIVKLHHFMVDYVVVGRPENHAQGYDAPDYRPEVAGEVRKPLSAIQPMPLNARKICGRRAALELKADSLINLGIGVPEAVAAVAAEEGIADRFTLSIESGVLGGVPLSGLGLGGTTNPEAIYKMADILNIYDGGGLDMAVLGMAEADEHGNVNVSKFGGRLTGPGGFINIAQNTKTVIFTGTFTAGGLKEEVRDGKLCILQEGRAKKFQKQVEQITFSGSYARKTGKRVLLITERAVFRLTEQGLELTEIAPGVDLEKDVLGQMDFRPIISRDLKPMDPRIFREEPMGLQV